MDGSFIPDTNEVHIAHNALIWSSVWETIATTSTHAHRHTHTHSVWPWVWCQINLSLLPPTAVRLLLLCTQLARKTHLGGRFLWWQTFSGVGPTEPCCGAAGSWQVAVMQSGLFSTCCSVWTAFKETLWQHVSIHSYDSHASAWHLQNIDQVYCSCNLPKHSSNDPISPFEETCGFYCIYGLVMPPALRCYGSFYMIGKKHRQLNSYDHLALKSIGWLLWYCVDRKWADFLFIAHPTPITAPSFHCSV